MLYNFNMSETGNRILEHLRAIRSDIGQLKGGQRELRAEMGSMRGYLSAMHMDIANTGSRNDSLETRVLRLEERLNLRDN